MSGSLNAVLVFAPAVGMAGIVCVAAVQVRTARRRVKRGRDVTFAPSAARRQGSDRPVPPDPPGTGS